MNKKNPTRIIEEMIFTKTTRQDKNGNDYLLLELSNKEAVFVFSSKVKSHRWSELTEAERYEFIVEESANGSNLLIDFTKLGDGIFI